jgi:hypothetical protein
MDTSSGSALVETGTLGAVLVAPSIPPLENAQTAQHIYYKVDNAMVRIYCSEELGATGAMARNAQLEMAHETKLADFKRLRVTVNGVTRSDLYMVRVAAVAVVRAMLGVEARAVDSHNHRKVMRVMRKSFKNATVGPVSPLTYISYDETTKEYTWTKTGTTHAWHLVFDGAAFPNPLSAVRAMRARRVEVAGAKPKMTPSEVAAERKERPRMSALKLVHSKPPIKNLADVLAVAKKRIETRDKHGANPPRPVPTPSFFAPQAPAVTPVAAVPTPAPPVQQADPAPSVPVLPQPPVQAPKPPHPTTGGKSVASCANQPRLTASESFACPTEESSETGSSDESVSDEDAAMPDAHVGCQAEDADSMCDEESDEQEEDEDDDDCEDDEDQVTTTAVVRMPIGPNEPVIGLNRAARALRTAYLGKLNNAGHSGVATPENTFCSDDFSIAVGLQSQIETVTEDLQRTHDQIASCMRTLNVYRRKRDLNEQLLNELASQLEQAQQSMATKNAPYVLAHYEELKKTAQRRDRAERKQAEHLRRGKFAKSC